MATVKFAAESPYVTYAKVKQVHDKTDYKYTEFQQNAGLLSNASTEKNERINIALFGIGRAGSIHLVNISKTPRINLKYVVDDNKNRLSQVQKEWNLKDNAMVHTSQAEQIFNDDSINGVIICTPTFTHESLITRALNAKKHVFCEKPIGENEEETKRCYELADKTGKVLFCAFNRRFDPSFLQLKERVQSGDIGQVHSIKTVARDCPLPSIDYLKISGGIFHDCLVHDIDLICWVLGEYPIEVSSAAHAFIPEIKALNDYDTVAAVLKFPSGAIGTIDVSRNAVYGYDQTIEAFGPKGVLRARNESPYPLVYETKVGQFQVPIHHSFPSRYHQAYVNELKHFCDLLQGICNKTITGENTLRISKIATTLEESVTKGKFLKVNY